MNTIRHDDPTIMSLRRRLDIEIDMLNAEIKALDVSANSPEAHNSFNDASRQIRGRLQERLTQCMVTRDTCWPNPWFVLKTLQDFYTEATLY
jgi:hypothetical protein